jgi:2-keto-4-pentenoate hydratase
VLQPETIEHDIAHGFVQARKAARALAHYPGTLPQSLNMAYAIQDEAIAQFEGEIVGWKVGRINPPLCDELGTTRLFGPAWANGLDDASEGKCPVGMIFKDGFGAAEAEFMFRFGAAPDAGKTRFSPDDAANLIDAVFVGFEIASSPFPGINELGPLVTISDFGNNNGLLVGPEIPDWRNAGLEDWAVETSIDGKIVGSGQASAFPEGLLGSVRLLIENLVERGYAISPGLLVSTGAVTGVHAITAGQHISARFGDFATLECRTAFATD